MEAPSLSPRPTFSFDIDIETQNFLFDLKQALDKCHNVDEVNNLDDRIQEFFMLKREELASQAQKGEELTSKGKRTGISHQVEQEGRLHVLKKWARKKTKTSQAEEKSYIHIFASSATEQQTEISSSGCNPIDTYTATADSKTSVSAATSLTSEDNSLWKLKYYDNLFYQIKKYGKQEFDILSSLPLPDNFSPYRDKMLAAINSTQFQLQRQNYHNFVFALQALLHKLTYLPTSELKHETPQRLINTLSYIYGKWFTKVNVLKNLKDFVVDLSIQDDKNIRKILQSNVSLQRKMKLLHNALFYALGRTQGNDSIDTFTGDFDFLNSTNRQWLWGKQIFTKGNLKKKLIRLRTCAPIMKGKLSLEYIAFLIFCQERKQKVVQFIHLDPINKRESYENLWIEEIHNGLKAYMGNVYAVVLPFDNLDDILSPDLVPIQVFKLKFLARMLQLLSFPEEIKKRDLVLKLINDISSYYFHNHSEIDLKGKRAFFGLFYAHLQERVIFALDPSPKDTIVINHCANGVDRTGAAIGCILASDFHRLGKHKDLDFHGKFLVTVNEPAIAIAKRAILEDRIHEMMAVLDHLEEMENVNFPSSEDNWQLKEFILAEDLTQTHPPSSLD